MILGCHVNFGEEQLLGSAKQAYEYGANCFMFYTGAPQNTVRRSLKEEFIKASHDFMKEKNMDLSHVICHAPYIINLANRIDESKWQFGIDFLKKEIARCEQMGIKSIVLHPGSSVSLTHEEGIKNIIDALNLVVNETMSCKILLETMAGKGSECGCNLEEIKMILDGVRFPEKFGVCLDTCHLHDAGYLMNDFSNFLKQFDKLIGIEKIGCVHLNDSKNECGTHKDRHENIGMGKLGFDTLLSVLEEEKLKEVPKILETPYVGNTREDKIRIYPPYKFEIEMLKSRTFHPNLYEEIISYYKKP